MERQKKILIVEDNPDLSEMLAMRLEVNGYSVAKALDGEEALAEIKKDRPDLIIMDLMLPKIDGFEVTRMLKFNDKYKTIPIIALSALSQQEDRDRAIKSGADACFLKPFDLELLLVKIKSLIH